jgi:hypothetical protein
MRFRFYLHAADRSAIFAHWEPRIGSRAARAYVRGRFCSISWPTLGLAFFITYVLGVRNSILGLMILAYLVLGLSAVSILYGLYSQWLAWHLAGRVLGTKISMLRLPPGPEVDYERWCTERGVTPHRGEHERDRIPRHEREG